MRIGLLTSWRVPCGIYQYSSRLADAFVRIGHEPVILAGRADEHRSVPEESLHEVHDIAAIGLWRDDGLYGLDTDKIVCEHDVDAVHVQYQSMLFQQTSLGILGRMLHAPDMTESNPRPFAVTFHDNCQAPDFPYDAFDLRFTHRAGVGAGAEVIPFGIENRPPLVRTFGLGRTRSDLIEPICERNGWVFETTASHEPIHGGDYHNWQSHADLMTWLRGADAVVLWYDDVAAAGSSLAARTAMATRRPLFVNDTTWFRDLPARGDNFWKVATLTDLEHHLQAVLARPYIEENSWEHVAQLLVDRYASVAQG